MDKWSGSIEVGETFKQSFDNKLPGKTISKISGWFDNPQPWPAWLPSHDDQPASWHNYDEVINTVRWTGILGSSLVCEDLCFVGDNNVFFAVVAAFSQMEKEPGDQNTVILILCDLIFDEFTQDIIFQII